MTPEQLLALEKPLLRPSTVAQLLGVSRSTVYRWFWEGKLSGVKLFDTVLRISRDSVVSLLADSSYS